MGMCNNMGGSDIQDKYHECCIGSKTNRGKLSETFHFQYKGIMFTYQSFLWHYYCRIPPSVKIVVLSTLGDIAIAVGAEFKVYLEPVLSMLQQAQQLQVDKVDNTSCDLM